MALIVDLAAQALQMFLVLALAPLVLGITRKVKARLLRRAGHAATNARVTADAGSASGLLAGHYLPFAFPALSFTRSPR